MRSLRRALKPRKDAILVRSREPTIAYDVRDKDRGELSGLAHCAPRRKTGINHKPNFRLLPGIEEVNTNRIGARGSAALAHPALSVYAVF